MRERERERGRGREGGRERERERERENFIITTSYSPLASRECGWGLLITLSHTTNYNINYLKPYHKLTPILITSSHTTN